MNLDQFRLYIYNVLFSPTCSILIYNFDERNSFIPFSLSCNFCFINKCNNYQTRRANLRIALMQLWHKSISGLFDCWIFLYFTIKYLSIFCHFLSVCQKHRFVFLQTMHHFVPQWGYLVPVCPVGKWIFWKQYCQGYYFSNVRHSHSVY